MTELTRHIALAERTLGNGGRVLVRWSGTEPKLRLMLEGPDPDALKTMVSEMADAARRDLAASA
jgi:phosphoglucosamine mutase